MEAVLLNSGGIDSRVIAAHLDKRGWTLHSFFVDWVPDVSAAAGRAAEQTAMDHCISHEVFPWPVPMLGWRPDRNTFDVPYTGGMIHLLGSMHADTLGIERVVSGMRQEAADSTRDEWLNAWYGFMTLNRMLPPKLIHFPAWDWSDDDVANKARQLGVNLGSAWSCLQSSPACGECSSCRRAA